MITLFSDIVWRLKPCKYPKEVKRIYPKERFDKKSHLLYFDQKLYDKFSTP